MTTHFVLPPGHVDVVDKLRLDGRFAIGRARFRNYDVQAKINELSHRGRGRDRDEPKDSIVSNLEARFTLAGGELALTDLRFAVPGAVVTLAGRYALRSEALDFHGRLLMDASVSETTSGLKRFLLKPIDPLFRKRGGGSAVPIKVTGTREKPDFGLEVGRVFKDKAD
jgi:hypothetical protein